MAQESHYNQLIGLLQPFHWSIAHGKTGNIRLCAAYGIVPDLMTGRSTNLEKSVPTHLVRAGEPQYRLVPMAQHHAIIMRADTDGLGVWYNSIYPAEARSPRLGAYTNEQLFARQVDSSPVMTVTALVNRLSGAGEWQLWREHTGGFDQIYATTQRFIQWAIQESRLQPGDARVAQDLITAIQSTPPLRSR